MRQPGFNSLKFLHATSVKGRGVVKKQAFSTHVTFLGLKYTAAGKEINVKQSIKIS